MDKNDDKSFKIIGIIVISMILILAIIFIGCGIIYVSSYAEYKYELLEIDDDIYAIYYRTISTVPAYNYDVVTINTKTGIYTFNGYVNIYYSDDTPYAYIKKYNQINSDKISIYIPKGSLKYQESVGLK